MFVGLQHNSQSKHLVIFKSSSTTSISLHRKQEWDMEAQFKEKEHTGKKGYWDRKEREEPARKCMSAR